MADNEKPAGDHWIWLFLIVLGVILISSRGDGLFGGSGIRFGSPSREGTVEEELRPAPSPAPSPTPPAPAPLPTPIVPISPGQLNLLSSGGTRLELEREHIQISAPNLNKIKVVITGLILKNRNNETIEVGRDEFGSAIFLNPGERAVIATGESPRGFNFKVNKCSGYLAQNKTYYPDLPFSCPRLDELAKFKNLKEKCQIFVERIAYCTSPTINFSSGIDDECSQFVAEHANYTGCVKDFKNDADFDQKEWRIFMGRESEFWSNRHDSVRIFDQAGNLISEVSY
ncbi:hypothetical protein A2757_03675 [Candidatus Giovannonibacteria bacterium RIFCSPHIGHO2_01_FULL_48_47]|nr:MAG: hypothetical protein A2757_03675 [Candidatus Giovannonibacteria bacterium RIFCSPHIGHO2_01_FULL_48_47]OGF68701.1 MAG: hypothetical protein A3D61_01260 [Candidatus Giovannonibacteria bacterium RIFCSPHIGHO2_02_FULL_48_15]OGF89617.1 MAG: hypothetical protein A3B26_02685 [Candidatus Giovannonibacteria bacterium RIFCSPLOWO2_01_FULL_48_47]OGF95056.1 MAG: hypothetical protein A2433_00145 [Candidatus Giovannonibacteria bacterium RIFOXYC1_FULL_48_8]OGF96366.1 MAG: hypothetical protein A2613_02280